MRFVFAYRPPAGGRRQHLKIDDYGAMRLLRELGLLESWHEFENRRRREASDGHVQTRQHLEKLGGSHHLTLDTRARKEQIDHNATVVLTCGIRRAVAKRPVAFCSTFSTTS